MTSDRAEGGAIHSLLNGTGVRTKTILWIDDEIPLGHPMARYLSSRGFLVHCAKDGMSGLEMARSRRYDAIILDLRLPDGSGITVLEHLREDCVSSPVLVLSAWADLQSAFAAGRLGAVDVKEKPILGGELVTILAQLTSAGMPLQGSTPPLSRLGSSAHGAGMEGIIEVLSGLDALSAPVASLGIDETRRDETHPQQLAPRSDPPRIERALFSNVCQSVSRGFEDISPGA